MAELIIPAHLKPARQRINVVFYRYPKLNNRIEVGFPEQFPAPNGAEKIICTTAREVEKYSALMREQDKRDAEMSEIERERVEGPMRDYARKDLQHRLANAKNQFNKDFLQWALDRIEEKDRRAKEVRESHMHAEGYEHGK
jgi:hypothetical protein